MSQSEIERFQSDIKIRTDLVEKIKLGGQGLGAITETARSEGYEFDLDELKGYVVAKSAGTLSDEQLAGVAAAGSTWASTNTVVLTYTAGIIVGIVVGAIVLT